MSTLTLKQALAKIEKLEKSLEIERRHNEMMENEIMQLQANQQKAINKAVKDSNTNLIANLEHASMQNERLTNEVQELRHELWNERQDNESMAAKLIEALGLEPFYKENDLTALVQVQRMMDTKLGKHIIKNRQALEDEGNMQATIDAFILHDKTWDEFHANVKKSRR